MKLKIWTMVTKIVNSVNILNTYRYTYVYVKQHVLLTDGNSVMLVIIS